MENKYGSVHYHVRILDKKIYDNLNDQIMDLVKNKKRKTYSQYLDKGGWCFNYEYDLEDGMAIDIAFKDEKENNKFKKGICKIKLSSEGSSMNCISDKIRMIMKEAKLKDNSLL